jgi:hypothetical protein
MRGMLYLPAIKLVCLAYIICTFYIYNYILNLQIALPYIVRATAYTWMYPFIWIQDTVFCVFQFKKPLFKNLSLLAIQYVPTIWFEIFLSLSLSTSLFFLPLSISSSFDFPIFFNYLHLSTIIQRDLSLPHPLPLSSSCRFLLQSVSGGLQAAFFTTEYLIE